MADTEEPTEYMLTTVDNPFNPFTQYDSWLGYDEQLGHHTNAYLARLVVLSDALSEADQLFAVQSAIQTIVDENILGLFRKVSRNDFGSEDS